MRLQVFVTLFLLTSSVLAANFYDIDISSVKVVVRAPVDLHG